jgi:UDP-glucose 4-epimerase
VTIDYAPARDGEVRRSSLSVARSRSALRWTTAVALEEGLAATLDWFAGRRAASLPAAVGA